MKDMNAFLDKVMRESALPSITLNRLRIRYPLDDWSYTGDFCLHQGEIFLHFAESVNRRMWWVRVDEEFDGELAMTWHMGEISDLV